jgi:serine 3-dehydrogenase (NADP+)
VIDKPVVIVTGASGGIGEATARYFAARGWAVVLAARSADTLARIAAEIERGGGRALAVPTDVTVIEERETLIRRTASAFGRVDALINNAGMGLAGTLETLDLGDLDTVFRLNVQAPVALLQAVVPLMRARGGGVIVNISSIAEAISVPYMSGYGASKAALGYLTDAAAVELVRDHIAVVKVLPGLTETGFDRHVLESGESLSLEQLLAKADFISAMPPERVAATIWDAVRTRKSRRCLALRDRLFCFAARHAPGLTHALLKVAVQRYVSPEGKPSDTSIVGDVNRAGLAVGGIVAAAALLAAALQLWLGTRRSVHRKVRQEDA